METDLGVHLEAALRGVVLGDRWPKSGAEVVVTILESDDEETSRNVLYSPTTTGTITDWANMNVLAGCITASSAALIEAGIDCVDLVTGGCAALVSATKNADPELVVDPNFAEHSSIHAACVVGYLSSEDELVEMWIRSEGNHTAEAKLIDQAVFAARGSRTVLAEVLTEYVETRAAAKLKLGSMKSEAAYTASSTAA